MENNNPTEKLEEIQKRLEALEESLSEEEKVIALTELNTLISEINESVEDHLDKMKIIELQQKLRSSEQ
ncbi:MAG: hypothetical protein ACSLEX_03315 [Minisyncoccota bacterium]